MESNINIKTILQQLAAEKNLDRATIVEAIRAAIEIAAKKSLPRGVNVMVELEEDTLTPKVFEIRTVVEKVEHPEAEIALEEARKHLPEVQVGQRLKILVHLKDFSRIAAQTAKQVITQKLRDAERDRIYEEFKQREGDLVTGKVKRVTRGSIFVTVGRAEAILPSQEQSPRENYREGDQIRAYLAEVAKDSRGTFLKLSRTSKELVRRLFEREVPEIYDGTVEIKAIARVPGSRTKIAVRSKDPNVDPVGACVGIKGTRVRAVVEELSGEKIDIIRWSDNPVEMCASALNPADIIDVTVDSDTQTIHVVVPNDQLALAIGKGGQNARLASQLVGWNIDIRGDVERVEKSTKTTATAETPGVDSSDASPADTAAAEEASPAAAPETVQEDAVPAVSEESA